MIEKLNLTEDIRSKVKHWLSDIYDAETRAEIKQLVDSNNESALADAFYKNLEFGTGGLRGIMGAGSNRMNKYTVGAATQGLANYLKKSFPNDKIKVAIAYDSRNRSDEFAQITADIFSANDIKVYLFEDLRPTPELSFAIRHLGCKSGVVLTASHNPKEYNGYKAYWEDGSQLVAPHDQNVIAEVQKIKVGNIKFEAKPELIQSIGEDIDKIYLAKAKELSIFPEVIKAQKDLKIVFTPIHGTAITLVPKLLKGFGFESVYTVEEQAKPNGNFPTVIYPNPEEAEALSMALAKAKEIDADLLLGTDPDTDRVGIAVKNLDNNWQLLNGNQTAVLLIHYLLKAWQKSGKIIGQEYIAKTIVTTDLLDDIAKKLGVDCVNTLTGFKHIATALRNLEGKKTYIAGGEESYGYLVGDFVRDKDAVTACALIAEMTAFAKNEGKSIFENLVDIYEEYSFYLEKLVAFKKEGKTGEEAIKNMLQDFRTNPPQTLGGSQVMKICDYQSSKTHDRILGEQTSLDFPKSNVLQFFTEDGSKVSVRPSGTEPKIKFYISVKADLPKRTSYKEVKKDLEEKIQNIATDMGI